MLYIMTDKDLNILQTQYVKGDIDLNIPIDKSQLIFKTNNTDVIDKYNNAFEYSLIVDEENELIDIKVEKTNKEHEEEQKQNPTIVEEVVDEEKMAMAEAIVNLTMELEEIKTQIGGIK